MYISNYHRIYLNSYIKMEHMHSIWCVGIETYEIRSVICSVDSETSSIMNIVKLSPLRNSTFIWEILQVGF